jgi:hypothetical protein
MSGFSCDDPGMTNDSAPRPAVPWVTFTAEAPDLAAAVEARLRATKHHVLATLRADGSPRVSGTEVDLWEGELVAGSMWGAVKARDLLRDGRFAVHANPGDGSMEGGDAKVSGVAEAIEDPEVLGRYVGDRHPPEPFHLFRLRLTDAVLTALHPDGDRLVVTTWHPGGPPVAVDRR